MKKTSLILVILVSLLGIMLIATPVFAADNDIDFIFEDENGVNNTPSQNTSITPTNNTPANNTPANNTPANNTPANNTSANNASVYNNTSNTPNSLSKAGLEDSVPTMVLIVVFGISAIYAYKKIRDYKNI